jgi:hypothetical protein
MSHCCHNSRNINCLLMLRVMFWNYLSVLAAIPTWNSLSIEHRHSDLETGILAAIRVWFSPLLYKQACVRNRRQVYTKGRLTHDVYSQLAHLFEPKSHITWGFRVNCSGELSRRNWEVERIVGGRYAPNVISGTKSWWTTGNMDGEGKNWLHVNYMIRAKVKKEWGVEERKTRHNISSNLFTHSSIATWICSDFKFWLKVFGVMKVSFSRFS